MTARRLTRAEMNHLRRLIGWVRCEVGAEPEEIVTTAKEALDHFQCVTEDGKQRLLEHYQKSVYARLKLAGVKPTMEATEKWSLDLSRVR